MTALSQRSAHGFGFVALALVACSGPASVPADAGPKDSAVDAVASFAVAKRCPSTPGCATNEGPLRAGAARVDISPTIDDSTEVPLVDRNGNATYDPSDGDTFRDTNRNGRFEGVWIGGNQTGRAARSVRNAQWASAFVITSGDTSVAFVSLDLVGFFYDEILTIRERVRGTNPDIDYVVVGSTHNHQGRDTVGIWGQTELETGRNAEYNELVVARAADAVRRAAENRRDAVIQYATAKLRDKPGGVNRYVSDVRDMNVIDDEIRVMRFLARDAQTETIATFVNASSHAEYEGSANPELSSDYAHHMRAAIESGTHGPDGQQRAGVGGITVFFQGAIGSQIGPGAAAPRTWPRDAEAARDLPSRSLETAEVVGNQLGYFVLDALGPSGGGVTETSAAISFRTHELFLTIENTAFQGALAVQVFTRGLHNWTPSEQTFPGVNEPQVKTEIAVIDIGRAQLITVPGELDPAAFVGGYDGSFTPVRADGTPGLLVDPMRETKPDLQRAPMTPYLRDRMRSNADYRWVLGLTNDFAGYLIPAFDYKLHDTVPYFERARGHYEETNSLGPRAWPELEWRLNRLLAE